MRRSVWLDRVKSEVVCNSGIIGQLKHRSAAISAYFVTGADCENADHRHEAADWNRARQKGRGCRKVDHRPAQ
eukprot:15270617-Heterocapsa_arctica.AAC.1